MYEYISHAYSNFRIFFLLGRLMIGQCYSWIIHENLVKQVENIHELAKTSWNQNPWFATINARSILFRSYIIQFVHVCLKAGIVQLNISFIKIVYQAKNDEVCLYECTTDE